MLKTIHSTTNDLYSFSGSHLDFRGSLGFRANENSVLFCQGILDSTIYVASLHMSKRRSTSQSDNNVSDNPNPNILYSNILLNYKRQRIPSTKTPLNTKNTAVTRAVTQTAMETSSGDTHSPITIDMVYAEIVRIKKIMYYLLKKTDTAAMKKEIEELKKEIAGCQTALFKSKVK